MAGELAKLKELDVAEFLSRWEIYEPADLKDKLGGAPRAAVVAFAEGLQAQVGAALDQLQQSLPDDADAGEAGDLAEKAEAADAALQALRLSALLCLEVLSEVHANPPEALMAAAITLHDHALLELGDSRPDVQDAVARLCCSWWQLEAENREFLVSQALPYLLLRAISSRKAAHVKACHTMRGALELLDFEDASINDMKRMLLQAAICPAFVSRPEGRKFLSALLTVHPSMVGEMASVIRNQIPGGRRSVLDAYGEVILRGWRDAAGPCLAEIEDGLIQNLIMAALHGSSQGLVSNIRRVLGELHRSKRLGGAGAVDGMLARLYGPLLFRALAAANAGVRRNALQLLLDAFPLLDPDASTDEQDELLVRQFQALSDGLTDPCPSVRVAAAAGTCAVLNLYWEIIPSATTAGFVSRLTGQLAFDGALPAVRVAVLEGLQLLVDNQHAQPVLKRALPHLAPLMWDSSPRVREAMADLLLCISTSRGLHFYEVVPLEVLLEQLASEGGASAAGSSVAQKLHHLLVPSYLPNAEEGAARIAALLKDSPAAGCSFCRLLVAPYLSYRGGGKGSHQVQVALEDILGLAAELMGHLLSHPPAAEPASPPRKQQRGRRADAATGEGTNGAGRAGSKRKKAAPAGGGDEAGSSAAATAGGAEGPDHGGGGEDVVAVGAQEESPESWHALLSGLAEICGGVGMALQHGLCEEPAVQDLFPGDSLQQLLAACPAAPSERCVWRIAQALPCLTAAKQLLGSRMQLLAAGGLLPEGLALADVARVGAGLGGDGGAAADAAAVVACLAAGGTGARLAAMLRSALGLEWCGGAAATAGSALPPKERHQCSKQQQDACSDIVCWTCGQAQPEDNLLLCDSCDAAHHTTCLEPPLPGVPEGDWFCGDCCADIAACGLGRGEAAVHISLLLLSDSGRQLLLQGGLLGAALPLLREEAAAAAAAAAAQAADATAPAVAGALQSALLCARATLHLAAEGIEERPAALAEGLNEAMQQLSSSCALLRQLPRPLGAAPADARELLSCACQLLALLGDATAAARLLGGLAEGDGTAAAALASAAGAAADCGCALLGVVAAAGEAIGAGDAGVRDGLVLSTQLLRALLALPCSAAPCAQQRLSAWLAVWLQLLAAGPLAESGAVAPEDAAALFGALLGGSSGGDAPPRGGQPTSAAPPARSLGDDWLPILIQAAAEAEEAAPGQQEDDALQAEGGGGDENQNPNARRPSAESGKAAGRGGRGAASAARLCTGLELPLALQAFVAAANGQEQARTLLAGKCAAAAACSAQASEWQAALGALRLAALLGCRALPEGQRRALEQARGRALEGGATAVARLFSDQAGRLLVRPGAA